MEQDAESASVSRRILVVARNHTAVNWVNELLPALVFDFRIQTYFSIPTTQASLWTNGVEDTLRSAGAIQIPWERALADEFDLAIAATHLGDLDRLRSPLLLLPHGPGFTRKSAVRPDGTVAIPHMTGKGRPLTTVVLSHPLQRRQFIASSAVRFVVAGDPCWDILRASESRRDWYRRAFGIGVDQRFVLISSTWGRGSLLGRCTDVIESIVGSLPSDEYQVGLVLHPNIWSAHGAWQLRAWLARPLDSGLRLLTPNRAWRAGIVAADLVIGDHGSVGLYAYALGRPVLLACADQQELVAESTIEYLIRRESVLDGCVPILDQIESKISDGLNEPSSLLADASFAECGQAHKLHRALLYELLDLEEVASAVEVSMAPAPEFEWTLPQAWLVRTEVSEGIQCPIVSLIRHPAKLVDRGNFYQDSCHIAAFADGASLRLTQSAAVIIAEGGEAALDIGAARRDLQATLDRFGRIDAVVEPDARPHTEDG